MPTTGGIRFYPDFSQGGDLYSWMAQRLICWQKANPSAIVRTLTTPELGYEVPNPMPAGLIMKDGGPDWSAGSTSGWTSVYLNASQVSTIDANTCGKTPGGGALAPYQFAVSAYGAKGDDVTDDTAAINAAHAAAYAYALAHNGYYEVIFDALTYLVASPPTVGGATQGNAQIPWPYAPDIAQKVIGVLKGTVEQAPLYHWLQQAPQRAGTVIRSTWDAGGTIPAEGEASVIGGPTGHFVGTPPTHWDNMLPVIDGIQVEVPNEPNVCGIDFRCMAQALVKTSSVLAAQKPGVNGAPPIPSPGWAFGLAMPVGANNDRCDVGYYSCEGLTYGLIAYEHLSAESIRLINCYTGLLIWPSLSTPHLNRVGYASIENCRNIVVTSGSTAKLDIQTLDVEWGSGPIFNDQCSTPARGTIHIGSNGTDGATLNTALNSGGTAVTGTTAMRIINEDQETGPVTPPAIPASGTALRNPFWRDATVTINTGTVTAIAVGGVAQGITAGSVTVPTGKTITLTYSVAPTSWAWTLS